MRYYTTDICIIGAGSGGLSVAAGAAQMGASVVLVENGKMGGDCLNYGCVPSKALLAAGKRAHAIRTSDKFGIKAQEPLIDFKAVHDHVHGVIGAIEPNDSQERFEKLGVTVIRGFGSFTGDGRVLADDARITAKKYIIATGSSPFLPPIPGLDKTPYFTNETLFDQTTCPEHLIVIGGGPIGIEMAQAHLRLGAKVTVIDQAILPNDDPELVDVVRQNLIAEGLHIIEGDLVQEVSKSGSHITVKTKNQTLKGSHLLVATGRKANLKDLGLTNAGVEHTPKGIQVNDRLQTSNKNIYAIGDCIGDLQFTHVAGYHAGIVIRNILFKLPSKINKTATPWVTYCDPELAHVGLTEAQVLKKFPNAVTLRFPFKENDRALAEHATQGLIKIITTKKGTVLGASIVGKSAGDLLMPWILAVKEHKKIADIATLIAPYPTLSEVNKRVASSFFTPKLFSTTTKRVVKFLLKWL